jgi:hypothetical protein
MAFGDRMNPVPVEKRRRGGAIGNCETIASRPFLRLQTRLQPGVASIHQCMCVGDAASPPMLDLSRFTFRFMPDIPHEYVVRSSENVDAFVALFHVIRRDGEFGRFAGQRYRYWRHEGWTYWAMPDSLARCQVINQAELADDEAPDLSTPAWRAKFASADPRRGPAVYQTERR